MAADNLAPVDGKAWVGDLLRALPRRLRGRIDLLAASPPYVPTRALGLLPAEARDHERRDALDGGPDGLDLLRRIARESRPWLADGGSVALEVSPDQLERAADLLADAGYRTRMVESEDGEAGVVVGRWRR